MRMPMWAYGKWKKTKVHVAVGETSVKTVEVSVNSQRTTTTCRERGSEYEECDLGRGTDVWKLSKTVLDLYLIFLCDTGESCA
jgi:hypothetical protein